MRCLLALVALLLIPGCETLRGIASPTPDAQGKAEAADTLRQCLSYFPPIRYSRTLWLEPNPHIVTLIDRVDDHNAGWLALEEQLGGPKPEPEANDETDSAN